MLGITINCPSFMDKNLSISLRAEIEQAAEEIRAGNPGWKIQSENPKVLRAKIYQVLRELFTETADDIYLQISVVFSAYGEEEVWLIHKKETSLGRRTKYTGTKGGNSESL